MFQERLGNYEAHYELIDRVMRERHESALGEFSADGFYSWAGRIEELRLTFQNQKEPRSDGSPSWGSAHELYIEERVKPRLEILDSSPGLIVEIGVGPTARLIRNWADHFPKAEILGIDLDPRKAKAARNTLEQLGYDLSRIHIVEGEASQVLSGMRGETDVISAQNLFQHLSSKKANGPSPFEIVVGAMENVLKPGGLAVVSDLLLAGPESWRIIPKKGFEADPELSAIMELHRKYIGDEQRPGIFVFGWLGRGAHIWRAGEDITAEIGKYTNNLHLIESSQKDYSAGYTTGKDNNPCSVIGATVPPTIALGVERAKAGLESALASPHLPEQKREELSGILKQLAYAANFCWEVGEEYLERVYYNPEIKVSMPWISFQMWEKGSAPAV